MSKQTVTTKRKRPMNPLQQVLNMAKWYYSDNKFKHSIPARVDMKAAMQHVKKMVKP